MAAHALKGAAESCCATSLAEAAFELENFAATFTGFNGTEAGAVGPGASAAEEAALEHAAGAHVPRIEKLAAAVVERIRFLEGLSPEQQAAHLAAAEGFPERVVPSAPAPEPEAASRVRALRAAAPAIPVCPDFRL